MGGVGNDRLPDAVILYTVAPRMNRSAERRAVVRGSVNAALSDRATKVKFLGSVQEP